MVSDVPWVQTEMSFWELNIFGVTPLSARRSAHRSVRAARHTTRTPRLILTCADMSRHARACTSGYRHAEACLAMHQNVMLNAGCRAVLYSATGRFVQCREAPRGVVDPRTVLQAARVLQRETLRLWRTRGALQMKGLAQGAPSDRFIGSTMIGEQIEPSSGDTRSCGFGNRQIGCLCHQRALGLQEPRGVQHCGLARFIVAGRSIEYEMNRGKMSEV